MCDDCMKILFYVEPLIEMSKPYWKDGWACSWCRKMIQCLADKHEYIMVVNDAIAERFGEEKNVRLVIPSQQELLKVFPAGYMQASKAWYLHTYSEEQINYYVSLMRDLIHTDSIDLILTFTQVPFLEKLYPLTRILHMEYSIFSRIPFPMTWYLDPCGLYENNFLNKYSKEISQIKLNESELYMVRELQKTCIEVFSDNNIFEADIIKLRQQFKYLLLLPIQFSGYYGFDCLSSHKTQLEYLMRTLEDTPSDIGIIFTMHPEYPIFDKETVGYITSRYKNAIFLEKTRDIYAASQWILPLVDGVITVSSSVGIQTLLFEKKLISLGNHNFKYIADGNTLGDDLYRILSVKSEDKSSMLWFIITKYAIPYDYLFNENWLDGFFRKSVLQEENERFYDDIDIPIKLCKSYIKEIRNNKALIPQWVLGENVAKNKYAPKIYYWQQGGYSEDYSLNADEISFDGSYRAFFDISKKSFERFRFDPAKNVMICLNIQYIDTDAERLKLIDTNASFKEGDKYYFTTTDPTIVFSGGFNDATYIELKYEFYILNDKDLECIINKINANVKELSDELLKKDNEIKHIKKSKIYKILCAFRKYICHDK